jgi:O-antigen/teichoic acid export membrane protein
VGLTHGLRNRFAEAKANDDIILARKYVSTTYATLIAIFGVLALILVALNSFLNWELILNVSLGLNSELRTVFFIIIVTNCLSFVLKVFPTILLADQKTALSYSIHTIGQFFVLITIIALVQFKKIPLHVFALVITGIPCIVQLFISILAFKTRYSLYSPSFKYVDTTLIKKILGLGIRFFVIQVDLLIIFQMTNVIISRILGPSSVTVYNIANTYYNAFFMIFSIVITPYWSAFTDAYTRGDFLWMKKTVRNLKRLWAYSTVLMILMIAFSGIVFRVWVGDKVNIPLGLSVSFGSFLIIKSLANVYMFVLNGIGKVVIQLIIYSIFAIITIPLLILASRSVGLIGVVAILSLVYLIQAVFGEIQLNKILSKRQTGVWDK